MTSLVYHCKRTNGKILNFPNDFDLVAIVRSTKLEEVLELTNSIDFHWSNNRKVKSIKERARSTTVGDVIVTKEGIFRLGPSGWDEVSVTLPLHSTPV